MITTNVVGFFAAETLIETEALHRLFSSSSDQKGIIGPQLRYTDGRLKAAGGIVNSRKGAYGYGHLDLQPDHPRYKFARQVDFCPDGYLIKLEILHELGGFNEKYQTFEMAHIDLAFRARALGHASYYCPSGQVISYGLEEWDEASRNDFRPDSRLNMQCKSPIMRSNLAVI